MTRRLTPVALGLVLALLTMPVLATPIAARQPDRVKTSSPEKAGKSRTKALLAYQHDLVSVLAPRADALPLLAAALLARPLTDQPKVNTFHALIGRAAQAEGDHAAVNWVRLADCDAKAGNCPNPAALEQLQTEAPDNAAVWLLKLGVDTHNLKSDDARTDLSKAAAASSYDDYTGVSLKALAMSVGVLPPPAATIDPADGAGGIGVQTVLAFGLASAQPQPGLPIVASLCKNADTDASIKADCLKLAKTLQWGSSPLARSLGLHLSEVLSADPASQQDAKQARINLTWQVRSFAELLQRARGDATLAAQLLTLARSGGTEMSVVLSALREQHIPLDAPADWKPAADTQDSHS